MDFIRIRTRDDIFTQKITASLMISLSSTLTSNQKNIIKTNMGDVWYTYASGHDSVTTEVLHMGFYEFLTVYGIAGDIQGVKKYCSHHVDILLKDYNKHIGELFIRRYGESDPISQVLSNYIHDKTYISSKNGVYQYNTTRGERYVLDHDGVSLVSKYRPRRWIECKNGDKILKSGYVFWYNCLPMTGIEYDIDKIYFKDFNDTEHILILDDDGIIVSGYENLPSLYKIQNHSVMDVYDIYRLLKLGVSPDILIRDINMDYRVINTIESILTIEVWNSYTRVIYKNGNDNIQLEVASIDYGDEKHASILDYDGKSIIFSYNDLANFIPIRYNIPMILNGYMVEFVSDGDIIFSGYINAI